ncbi:hypothetical protein QQF64_007857, partial [Cirrhinus molitorella]
MVSNIIAL